MLWISFASSHNIQKSKKTYQNGLKNYIINPTIRYIRIDLISGFLKSSFLSWIWQIFQYINRGSLCTLYSVQGGKTAINVVFYKSDFSFRIPVFMCSKCLTPISFWGQNQSRYNIMYSQVSISYRYTTRSRTLVFPECTQLVSIQIQPL